MKILLNDQKKLRQLKPIQKFSSYSVKNSIPIKKLGNDIPLIKSEERASAIFSLLLLLEHRDHWNWKEGVKVDWKDAETKKWCITVINDQINIINTFSNKKLLSFGTKESSLQFLETFTKLIDTAKDLL